MRINLRKYIAVFLFFFLLPFLVSFSNAYTKKNDKKSRIYVSDEYVRLGFLPTFSKIDSTSHRYYQEVDGYRVYYTVDPAIQEEVKKTFEQYKVHYGAFVAIEPETGKILAFADYSSKEPGREGRILLGGTYPAASIFKIITAAAAVELQNITGKTIINYRGGSYSLTPSNWQSNPKKDRASMTVEEAMGKSINVVFARVAEKYVGNDNLRYYAEKFGFNNDIPFELPLAVSSSHIDNGFKTLVRTAAGFGDVTLNPVFAAMISSSLANDGIMMSPYIVDKVTNQSGKVIFSSQPKVFKIPVKLETAEEIKKMMVKTIEVGTCKRTFYSSTGGDMPDISLYGKTGSLSGSDPRGEYSWFVGSGEKNGKNIAVAAMIINTEKGWKVKSAYVAKKAFLSYFNTGETLYVDNGPPKYKNKRYSALKKKSGSKGKVLRIASSKNSKKGIKTAGKKKLIKKGSTKQYSKFSRTKQKTSL